MKPIAVLATILTLVTAACAQQPTQNARQALLEMFFSKTPGTFERHLPEATRAALRKGDGQGLLLLQQLSLLAAATALTPEHPTQLARTATSDLRGWAHADGRRGFANE